LRNNKLSRHGKDHPERLSSKDIPPVHPHFITNSNDAIEVRPAADREELENAYHLVYQSYLRRGYIAPNPRQLRMTLFNAIPETITFVSLHRQEIIATVSLIPDSPAGLPMDEIYLDEVESLRSKGHRLAEVTMLADRRVEIRRTLPVLLSLMKLVFDYARLVLKLNDLCITINPRHSNFYKRYLLFDNLGQLRTYPTVRDNPAIACRLDLDNVRAKCEGHPLLIRLFFEELTPRALFEQRYRMSAADVRYFAELIPIIPQTPDALVSHVRTCYPELPWEKWLSGKEPRHAATP